MPRPDEKQHRVLADERRQELRIGHGEGIGIGGQELPRPLGRAAEHDGRPTERSVTGSPYSTANFRSTRIGIEHRLQRQPRRRPRPRWQPTMTDIIHLPRIGAASGQCIRCGGARFLSAPSAHRTGPKLRPRHGCRAGPPTEREARAGGKIEEVVSGGFSRAEIVERRDAVDEHAGCREPRDAQGLGVSARSGWRGRSADSLRRRSSVRGPIGAGSGRRGRRQAGLRSVAKDDLRRWRRSVAAIAAAEVRGDLGRGRWPGRNRCEPRRR